MNHKKYGEERHAYTAPTFQYVWNLNGGFTSKNVVEEAVAKRQKM